MSEKHSPGPWTVTPCDDRGRKWWTIDDADTALVTEVSSSESDARLIAAAPEMLSLLRVFVEAERGAVLGDTLLHSPESVAEAEALIDHIDGKTP